jgi:hypothetical protein
MIEETVQFHSFSREQFHRHTVFGKMQSNKLRLLPLACRVDIPSMLNCRITENRETPGMKPSTKEFCNTWKHRAE